MELGIGQRELVQGLARTHAATDRKSSIPMLSNVLLRVDGSGELYLEATDLFLSARAKLAAEVSQPGVLALSSKNLLDIVKNMPDAPLRLKRSSDTQITIECGKSRFKLPFVASDEFPELPSTADEHFLSFDAAQLQTLIGRTQFSMLHDDSRPHLAGALFQGQGQTLRMVTTDGHRLSKAELSAAEGADYDFSMFIPARAIVEIKRMVEDAKAAKGGEDAEAPAPLRLAKQGQHLFVERGGFSLSVKLGEEAFPPYDRVIPKQQSKHVGLDRALFAEGLKRINLVANDKTGGIRFELDEGKLALVSENPDVGEGREEIDADYAGEALTVGFNARYLLDALGAIDAERVTLALSGELDPGLLQPEGDALAYVGVVMPMRI